MVQFVLNVKGDSCASYLISYKTEMPEVSIFIFISDIDTEVVVVPHCPLDVTRALMLNDNAISFPLESQNKVIITLLTLFVDWKSFHSK